MSQIPCNYSLFSSPSSSLHHFTGLESVSSFFIKGQALVASLPHIQSRLWAPVWALDQKSFLLTLPRGPFHAELYLLLLLPRYLLEKFSLGWTMWTHFLFPAYRNELGSGRGQRQVLTAYFGLSPQEVALKRKKTMGILVRETWKMGFRE